ncbi:Uncharacterised protein [Shigella sonnei]|nr:Uncharacterised protein [Shigella sonnei]CSG48722.1 Uncharacterised protein [Shigella sonnei]
MLIAQRQRGHRVMRMMLKYRHFQNATLLLFRQPRIHHATAPHFLQRAKGFHLTVFQYHHSVCQMEDLIQRMADIQHRNVDFPCQPLQIRQQFAFTRNIQ